MAEKLCSSLILFNASWKYGNRLCQISCKYHIEFSSTESHDEISSMAAEVLLLNLFI